MGNNNKKRSKKNLGKRIVALLVALLMVLGVAATFFVSCADQSVQEELGTVVATVGDVNIYDYEVRFYAGQTGRTEDEMLDEMIASTRMMVWAEENGFTASKEELKKVETDFAEAKKTIGEAQIKQELERMGVTEKQYLDIMRKSVRYTAAFNAMFELGVLEGFKKEDVEKFYNENYLRAKHVLISFTDAEGNTRTEEEALKMAQDVKKRLAKGESMDTLMKELSDDPGSLNQPNGYVFINTAGVDEAIKSSLPSFMVTEFEQGTAKLSVGKVSNPVKTSYGYHVIQRLDIHEEGIFEANKNTVINDMTVVYQEAFNAEYERFMKTLESKYPVKEKK